MSAEEFSAKIYKQRIDEPVSFMTKVKSLFGATV
jgi:hypothetical protein